MMQSILAQPRLGKNNSVAMFREGTLIFRLMFPAPSPAPNVQDAAQKSPGTPPVHHGFIVGRDKSQIAARITEARVAKRDAVPSSP